MPSSQRQFRPPPSAMMRILYGMGLGRFLGRIILLLTTTGRKTGLRRVTPLQYEEIDGNVYVASALGTKADWYRNILANPCVEVRIGLRRQFQGLAETVTDPGCIADFLELRLKRHPHMVGAILKSEGLPEAPSRAELEEYARSLTMVIIRRLE
jgi:deazaflavin-dependent oxidoreductase (nitroreductase family)